MTKSAYNRMYYKRKRVTLLAKAIARYRANSLILSTIEREKYTPKIQRHKIYRTV